jgi:L-aminopeptidase/D-esterase-like protein
MDDAIIDVAGLEVGHAQDRDTLTGCSVVLCRAGAVVGVDVRGAAPGTRETDLCKPGTLVDHAHAVLLAGGSAFGLDAASGVMRYLWEREIGLDVGVATVPIVPGAVLFDLGIGSVAWPDADMGYRACVDAHAGRIAQGCVGAGTGATVGKLRGMAAATKSGIGTASLRVASMTLGALVAVNAFGDVALPGRETIIAGSRETDKGGFVDSTAVLLRGTADPPAPAQNTTIGVLATDAALTSDQINHLATCAHDGLARTIRPVHTMVDGDTIFALATGAVVVDWRDSMLALASGAAEVVARAVIAAIANATPAGGLPTGTIPGGA